VPSPLLSACIAPAPGLYICLIAFATEIGRLKVRIAAFIVQRGKAIDILGKKIGGLKEAYGAEFVGAIQKGFFPATTVLHTHIQDCLNPFSLCSFQI
jgi:hypothetical protein